MMVRFNKQNLQDLVVCVQDYIQKVEEYSVPVDKGIITTLRKVVNARDKAWGGSTISNFKWLEELNKK